MPKSKRSKVVALTKVKKDALGHKQKIQNKLNECVQKFDNIYVFSHENMTTIPFREIQAQWSDSRFFLGKNKVMQIVLGKDSDSEQLENLHYLTEQIKGDCGLLFTNKTYEEVKNFFDSYGCEEFAKAGHVANETIILQKDSDVFNTFAHTMDVYLRKLGVDVILQNGILNLQSNFVLCQEGKPINTEQAKLLKLLGYKIAQFKIDLKCYYHKPSTTFKKLN
ncbi:hypothetical protein ABPG72_011349 [Tetrahymena utriculariae]